MDTGAFVPLLFKDREFRHYKESNKDDGKNHNPNEGALEDELNLTKTELSMFYKVAQRTTERVTKDAVLRTSSMRDQEKMILLKKYPKVWYR